MMKGLRVFGFAMVLLVNAIAQPADFSNTNFKRADSVAAKFHHHSLDNLKLLADKLTLPLSTEEEKFRSIFRWVCHNIDYDYNLYLEHRRQKELNGVGDKAFTLKVIHALKEDHTTVCTGYAYLLRALCLHAGINCEIVNGYGRSAHSNIGDNGDPDHSWNAVQLHGKWYLCDPTWSSGYIEGMTGNFKHHFSDTYFLTAPGLFAQNHFPLDPKWLLLASQTDLRSFLDAPLTYRQTIQDGITPVSPKTFYVKANKGDTIKFEFTKGTHLKVNEAKIQLVRSGIKQKASSQLDSTENDCSIKVPFLKRGINIVNIMVNDAPAITYSVTVR